MSEHDEQAERWDSLYRADRARWDLRRAAPPLVRWIATLPAGDKALVLGCGRGYEAHVLAAANWREVIGVDFAPAALAAAAELTPPALVTRIRWLERDVFTLAESYAGELDLVIEHAFFCTLANLRSEPERLLAWRKLVTALLKPGGLLLGLFYTGAEGKGPHGSDPEMLKRWLEETGELRVEAAETPADSVPLLRGREFLVLARRQR